MTDFQGRPTPAHGWLVIDKPLGLSSNQVVTKVKHLTKMSKVGHGGTLDPLASGVLPIACGEATKTSSYILNSNKSYIFHVRFGESRTTLDGEGDVVARSDVRPTLEQLTAVLPQFLGDIQQEPPQYSAIKVGGQRAYKLARRGTEVKMAARSVHVYDIQLREVISLDEVAFYVSCGKGLYVRSLARDIAQSVGALGYVSYLRRTEAGSFSINNAISLESLANFCHKNKLKTIMKSIEDVLDDILAIPLNKLEAVSIRHGKSIPVSASDTDIVLATEASQAVALGSVSNGMLKPIRVFNF